jgi:hypothetical protein
MADQQNANPLNPVLDPVTVATIQGQVAIPYVTTKPAGTAGNGYRTIYNDGTDYWLYVYINGGWQSTKLDGVGFPDSPAQGDVLYYNGTAWVRLGAGSNGQALTTAGGSANPSWLGMTTQGDVEFFNGTQRARLAAGTSGQFLQTQGGGANPQWATPGFASRFYANGAGNQFTAGTPANFGNIVVDNNSEWDSTNKRWVCKVAGTYVAFAGHGQSYVNATGTVTNYYIRKNGSNICNSPSQVTNVLTLASGSSVNIQVMAVNDYLDVAASSGAATQYEQDACYFGVFRIA